MQQLLPAPDRLYPSLDPVALVFPALLVIATTQLGARRPGLRLRRLDPVAGLRGE